MVAMDLARTAARVDVRPPAPIRHMILSVYTSRILSLSTCHFLTRSSECDVVTCCTGGAGGKTSVMINGRSVAMASAFSIAQAYVNAVVDADACDKCEATAKLVAEQNEELWLEAVAIAEVRVNSMTYAGMSRNIWIEEFVETVKDGVASAFAEVRVTSGCAALLFDAWGACMRCC